MCRISLLCCHCKGHKNQGREQNWAGYGPFLCTENEIYACLPILAALASCFSHPHDLAKVGVPCLNLGRLGEAYHSLGAMYVLTISRQFAPGHLSSLLSVISLPLCSALQLVTSIHVLSSVPVSCTLVVSPCLPIEQALYERSN